MRKIALVFGLLVIVAGSKPGLTALPDAMRVGTYRTALAASSVRSKFFVDMYRLGVYLPPQEAGAVDLAELRDPKVAKCFAVNILYDGSLPDDVPAGWMNELDSPLNRKQSGQMKSLYRNLKPDDMVTINYTPERGTWIEVNGERKLSDEGHRLMDAYIDIWFGESPVSEDLKSGILG